MIRKWWINLLILSLPFWVGLIAGVLAHTFLQPETPGLFQADLGIAAFVFGGVVRQWSCFAVIVGFRIRLALVGVG
jgi:hypothetical protein